MLQDITEPGAAKKIVQQAMQEFGRIDVLINNAGMQRRHELVEFPDEDWKAVIELNLNALYYLSHEVAKIMIEQKAAKSSISVPCSPIGRASSSSRTRQASMQSWD